MAIDLDAIMEALLQRLKDKVPGVRRFSRRDLTIDQVTQDQQPYVGVVLTQAIPEARSPGSMPQMERVRGAIQVWCREKKDDPESPLLAVVRSVEAALERAQLEAPKYDVKEFWTTLGGLVRWVHPVDLQFYQGAEGEEAACIITIEMLAIP